MRVIKKFQTPEELATGAAELLAYAAAQAIKERDRFSVALSGGHTPRDMFIRLTQPPFGQALPWEKIHVFWGDERPVPPEHPDSNYRMAFQYLLALMPIPLENIHRVKAELDPQRAADDYETNLCEFFNLPVDPSEAGDRKTFDLVFLGMGDDGHTASLFPASPALGEMRRWVVANPVEKLDSWRITLTVPAINRARRVAFLVAGEAKRMKLREVLQGPYVPDELPAQLIKPLSGELFWLLDDSAGSLLSLKK